MKFIKIVRVFLLLMVLVFTFTTSVFAAQSTHNGGIVLESKVDDLDDVSYEWTPNYANVLPSDFPDSFVGGIDDRTQISDTKSNHI